MTDILGGNSVRFYTAKNPHVIKLYIFDCTEVSCMVGLATTGISPGPLYQTHYLKPKFANKLNKSTNAAIKLFFFIISVR